MKYGAICAIIIMLVGCSDNPIPKPRAYHRIALPERSYVVVEPPCPWHAEIPVYSKIRVEKRDPNMDRGDCWLTWVFPQFKGEIFLTYKQISKQNSLENLLQDMHEFTYEHQVKADRIESYTTTDSLHGKFGLYYLIYGDVASSMQFCVTDQQQHFLRGSFYFRARPNADSTAPVHRFLKKDIEHLVESLEWE